MREKIPSKQATILSFSKLRNGIFVTRASGLIMPYVYKPKTTFRDFRVTGNILKSISTQSCSLEERDQEIHAHSQTRKHWGRECFKMRFFPLRVRSSRREWSSRKFCTFRSTVSVYD